MASVRLTSPILQTPLRSKISQTLQGGRPSSVQHVHLRTPGQRSIARCSAQSGSSGDSTPQAQPGATVLTDFFSQAAAAAEAAAAAAASPQRSSTSTSTTSEDPTSSSNAVDRKAVLHEALKQLSEENIENAAQKYNLHEELFAELDFARINAFSASPFGGNPAAVVYLPYMPSDSWLQQVAKEFNLSETAYVVRRRTPGGPLQKSEDGQGLKAVTPGLSGRPTRGNEFDLRWFTPTCEVKLCGHATLASAHLLFTAGLLEGDCGTVIFHTLSGALRARCVPEHTSPLTAHRVSASSSSEGSASDSDSGEGGKGVARRERRRKGRGIIELSFPLLPVVPLEEAEWAGVESALGLPSGSLLWAGRNSLHYILAEVREWQEVLSATPDMEAVGRLPVVGVILTAPTLKGARVEDAEGVEVLEGPLARADFVARFFAPQAGVPEDPVTGSAFCSLGPFWAKRLGKNDLVGYQASERGGEVSVSVDEAAQRVALQGWAVMVQAGVLLNTIAPGAQ